MPPRKHVKPLPRFSFVTPEFDAKEMNWFKKHSGAARSHAAYWGGSALHRRRCNKQIVEEPDNTASHFSIVDNISGSRGNTKSNPAGFTASTVRRRGSSKKENVTAISLSTRSETRGHIGLHNPQYLSSVPSDIRAAGALFAAGLSASEFCAEGFVSQFVMCNHKDSAIMYSGYLLLSYAYYIALTGHGTKTVLFELKSQVIGYISAKIKSSDDGLSLECLTSILALGTPIVCLVSRDLPQRLSMREYIDVSMEEGYLCCQDSANTAQVALEERIIHRQAVRNLLLKKSTGPQDTDNPAILEYVTNYLNMYAPFATKGFLHVLTALVDRWP